jgi:hypothetical protein
LSSSDPTACRGTKAATASLMVGARRTASPPLPQQGSNLLDLLIDALFLQFQTFQSRGQERVVSN